VGQATGLLKDIPTVAEAIERTVKEAEEIIKGLATKANASPVSIDSEKPKVARRASSKTKEK
jgi:hypothetical protein